LSCTNCPRPVASPTSSITYYLTKKQCSATTTDFVKIIVEKQPQFLNIPSSAKICANDTFSFKLKDTLYSISWESQNYTFIDSNNIWHAFPPYNETYIFTQQWECNKNVTQKDTIQILVDDCNEIIEIPNVFTPNNDGVNDTWHINWKNTKGIKDFIVEIYDRWGLKVYESNNPLFEWNGKKCGQKKIEMLNDECVTGTYYYLIKYRIGKAEREFKGYISLLR
jgi:gliding motility-associated-like protein